MGSQQGRPVIGPDPSKLLLKRACEDEGSGYHLTVKKMLQKQPHLLNAPLNHYGSSALIIACQHGRIKVIRQLLSYPDININQRDRVDCTALHAACLNLQIEALELLLSHPDLDVNIPGSRGESAVESWHIEVVKRLLPHPDLDINMKDNDGDTPLHTACWRGMTEMVKLLLTHEKINVNARNNRGMLASDVCCESDHSNYAYKPIILQLLQNHSNPNSTAIPSVAVAVIEPLQEENTPMKFHAEENTVESNERTGLHEEVDQLRAEFNEMKMMYEMKVNEVHAQNRFILSKINEMEGIMLEKEKEWKDEIRRLEERFESRIKDIERKG